MRSAMETIVTQKELLFAAEQGANQAQDFNLKSLVCETGGIRVQVRNVSKYMHAAYMKNIDQMLPSAAKANKIPEVCLTPPELEARKWAETQKKHIYRNMLAMSVSNPRGFSNHT